MDTDAAAAEDKEEEPAKAEEEPPAKEEEEPPAKEAAQEEQQQPEQPAEEPAAAEEQQSVSIPGCRSAVTYMHVFVDKTLHTLRRADESHRGNSVMRAVSTASACEYELMLLGLCCAFCCRLSRRRRRSQLRQRPQQQLQKLMRPPRRRQLQQQQRRSRLKLRQPLEALHPISTRLAHDPSRLVLPAMLFCLFAQHRLLTCRTCTWLEQGACCKRFWAVCMGQIWLNVGSVASCSFKLFALSTTSLGYGLPAIPTQFSRRPVRCIEWIRRRV